MKKVLQDITFTIDLNELTRTEYSNIFEVIKDMAVGQINTLTYDPEDPNAELSAEQNEIINKLYLDN